MAARPKKQQPQKKRAALYVRVSSEEQVEGYSLDAQDRAGRLYIEAHEWELVGIYRDEGKSAWTDDLDKRPDFARMIADAEAGLIDVIVVHKLDRFARNLLVTLDTLARLEKVGVGFVSINENMDFTTPIGRVILATLAAFAQYYSDNLANEVRKGKRERKEQGLYNGVLPFGAAKDDDGVPVSHGETHAGLVLAFQLAASGKTDREIARAMNAAGYRTTGNRGANPFSKDTVRAMLQNRFYLGELPDGEGGWMPGKHAPLIDAALFEKAEAARLRNGTRPRRVKTEARSPWALSGLATCACGATMTAYGHAGGKQRVQCSRRTQTKDCDAPTFYAEIVEEQIGDFLTGFALPENQRGRLVAAWKRRNARPVDRSAERNRIRQKLDRLRVLYLEGDLGETEYRAQKAKLAEQLAALPTDTAAPASDAGDRLASFLADVSLAWQVATPEERNKLARQLFNKVEIENRTAVEVTPRPDLLPFFAALASESSSVMTYGRKRRGSLAPYRQFPDGIVVLASVPAALPRYTEGRPSKLSTNDVDSIVRAIADGQTLRDVSAIYDISPERVRQIVSKSQCVAQAAD